MSNLPISVEELVGMFCGFDVAWPSFCMALFQHHYILNMT